MWFCELGCNFWIGFEGDSIDSDKHHSDMLIEGPHIPLARDKKNDVLCSKQELFSRPWENGGFCLRTWP